MEAEIGCGGHGPSRHGRRRAKTTVESQRPTSRPIEERPRCVVLCPGLPSVRCADWTLPLRSPPRTIDTPAAHTDRENGEAFRRLRLCYVNWEYGARSTTRADCHSADGVPQSNGDSGAVCRCRKKFPDVILNVADLFPWLRGRTVAVFRGRQSDVTVSRSCGSVTWRTA